MASGDRWDEEGRPEDGRDLGGEPYPEPKRGMSTTVKVLLILLVVGVLLAVLCCGGIVYFFSQAVDIQQNPADIRATLSEIVDIDVPDEFQPQQGMKMNMGVAKIKMVAFQSDEGGMLAVMEMAVPGAQGADEEQQIRQQMEQQNIGQEDLTVSETQVREFEIKGQTSSFQFAKATDEQGNEFRQITGSFPGKGGTAVLMMQVPEAAYNEEQVVQMIESIR